MRRVLSVVAIVLVVLLILLAATWINRRAAARQLLIGWLDQRGIRAEVEVEKIELNGFVGKVRIGDPADPDVSVERVEVDYAVGMPWSVRGLGVTPNRIRLVRPLVKATWTDGKLSFGSLDPLIEEFTGQPPRPDSRSPLVIIETGRLRLSTEYGPVEILADARLDNGKLMRLHAVMPTAALKSGETQGEGLGGTLDLTTTGDRVAIGLDLSAQRFALAGSTGDAVRLHGTADLPYPDLKARRGDGRAVVDLSLTAERLSSGEAQVQAPTQVQATDAAVRLGFNGAVTGWIEDLRLVGETSSTVRAATLAGPGLSARNADIDLANVKTDVARTATGLNWSLAGPVTLKAAGARSGEMTFGQLEVRAPTLSAGGRDASFEASGPLVVSAGRFGFGDLSLTGTTGRVDLDLTHDGATLITATGGLRSTGGAWPLFGPVTADDVPELAEMKRALGDFALQASSFRLDAGSSGMRIALLALARITPVNGGALTISPVARALYQARPGELGGGAMSVVATRGKGLPEATVAIPDWRLTPGGFEARLDARAALDFGVARGLTVATKGLLASDTGRLTYATADCLTFAAERLELEDNDAEALSGRFCPINAAGGRPLVEVREGSMRADGIVRDVSAAAPFLAARIDAATGPVAVTGAPGRLGLEATIVSGRASDTTTPRRFNPLTFSGRAGLKNDVWTGGFDLTSGEHPVARVDLTSDAIKGVGGATFDTSRLIFAEGGLQPSALTPLVDEFVQSPVTGSVVFTGRFDWDAARPDDGTSSGRLVIPSLDFVSPAGPVKGLKGTVDFTSLEPLVTAPDQHLRLDSVETVAALTDLDVGFALDATTLRVAGGAIKAAGGIVRFEPFTVPLNGTDAFDGVIVLERVQLGDIVTGSGFGDKVQLDAVVSGRLPYTYDPKTGIRIRSGTLAAAQPGRLSIQREALTGLEAGGGGEGVPPNTVEDLAYQAMENLAFKTLSADVNSLDQGRLSVLFHVVGRHDPPERQELRLTIPELISREFLNRPLPLPSDTGIDLTLDTTLNLNQLISDLLAVNRARNGEPDAPAVTDPVETPILPAQAAE